MKPDRILTMFHRAAIALLLIQTSYAHHGQDFFVNLDARVPAYGKVTAFTSSTYVRGDSGDEETSLEPGFLIGTGFGTSFGLTAEWSNSDGSPFNFSGITPIFQWAIAVPDSPFRLGLSAAYHIADSSAAASSTANIGHSHGGAASFSGSTGANNAPLSFNPDAGTFNPDAPAPGGGHGGHAHSSHAHGGIHRHGEDFFATRLILEWVANPSTRLVGNLIVVSGGWSDIDFGYSVGLRHDFSPKWAVGLEAIGDLDSGGEHEVVGGAWFSPRHDFNLRLGLGTGIGPNSPELSIYSGLTWRF
ncbi:hypothetical protein [Haloferula sp.]|uniref:hypothetical protein n=1 Tax=Haloferula sp. TaxID=2497595 RepID=UPI003C73E2B0